MADLSEIIEAGWERRDSITPGSVDAELTQAIDASIDALDRGQSRVAERDDDGWRVNQWLKKAVLLYFAISSALLLMGIAWQGTPGIYWAVGSFVIAGISQTAWLWWRSRRILRELGTEGI